LWVGPGRSVAGCRHPFPFLPFLVLQPACLPTYLPACLLACLLAATVAALFWSVWMSALWTLPNCRRASAFAFLSPPPNCSLLACSEDQLIPLLPSSSSFFPSCTFRFLTVGLYFLQLASEQQVFHLLWSVRSRHTYTHTLSLSLSLEFTSTIFRYWI
jgi:hypothetical protein